MQDQKLLIVESPAKAKTLAKYLKGFKILASYGHVRDLVPKKGAVDPEHQFKMRYQLIEKNTKHVDEICAQLKKSDALYLATDPDREGEAISWHLCEVARERKLLKDKPVYRVAFHEITKAAVQAAVDHPRELSMDLIDAQQARRALDYLVGFNLSPLLWKKVQRGLSAGRVQSPALRMIVEREEEIERFVTREYWSIEADVSSGKSQFSAKLVVYEFKKLEQFSVVTEESAKDIETILREASKGRLEVINIKKSQKKRQPAAPFTTSTLQQEASRKLGFSTQKTMRVAQQLYEGIDLGEGPMGLITYMRTDSVHLANEAVNDIRELITTRYGKEFLPPSPPVYKTKSKNAQEAHEAIRPTMAKMVPEKVKSSLSIDQFKLYQLIWKRAIASQMIHATLDLVSIDMSCGEGNCFRANGSVVSSSGFMSVYLEGQDEKTLDGGERLLPPLKEGDKVTLDAIRSEQHFTEPPPRYSEASLVKSLEEHGIGRPSTYASIISTLLRRAYVTLEQKRFRPTDVGRVVNKFLTQYFQKYVDYDFTAKLEDELDAISRGEKKWIPVLEHFWDPFIKLVDTTGETVKRSDVTQEALDENCPKCSKPLSIRLGKRGRFVGCTGYPECDYTRSLQDDGESVAPVQLDDRNCPTCGAGLVLRQGKYGKFVGCSKYPECRYIESLDKPEDTQVQCPECEKGTLIKKKSRFGTFFYACNEYPRCKFAVNHPPLAEPCPKCSSKILTKKTTKRRGTEKVCPRKDCDFSESYPEDSSG